MSTDQYVTGSELGSFLFRSVMDYTGEQTPQYGTLEDGVYDKGDFVFVIPPESPRASAATGAGAESAEALGGIAPSMGRSSSSTVAVFPPTLIDLRPEVRASFSEAIVGSLNGLVAKVMGPKSVSATLKPEVLSRIAECETDEVCLLQICPHVEVELAVATVFEEVEERSYVADVIVIDVSMCSIVDKVTKHANQLSILRGRAKKAVKGIVKTWLP